MKIKVLYHSMTGNTKKVAETIAAAAGVPAEVITDTYSLSEPLDLLFVGDGVYAAQMHKNTKAFLSTLDASQVGNAAVFGTHGGQNEAIAAMTALLKERGIRVYPDCFSCKGKAFLFMNRHHPDGTDLAAAAQFARETIAAIKKA